MAYIHQIARDPAPVLERVALPVVNILDEKIQNLIDSLIITAKAADGVGIAAPQVSQPYRLFIMASRPNLRYPYAPAMPPTAVINPILLSHSDRIVKDWEGCLSVPGIRGQVPRSEKIEVEYYDRNGKKVRQELTGFVARIFQHELDHLNGILFVDRLESEADKYSEAEYRSLINNR